jgi:hypothetical protein
VRVPYLGLRSCAYVVVRRGVPGEQDSPVGTPGASRCRVSAFHGGRTLPLPMEETLPACVTSTLPLAGGASQREHRALPPWNLRDMAGPPDPLRDGLPRVCIGLKGPGGKDSSIRQNPPGREETCRASSRCADPTPHASPVRARTPSLRKRLISNRGQSCSIVLGASARPPPARGPPRGWCG